MRTLNRFEKHIVAAAAIAMTAAAANAAIVYSDVVQQAQPLSPASMSIAGKTFEVGFVQGYNFAYVTTTSVGAGIFVPLSQEPNPTNARSFAQGDTIGTSTGVLDMYPLGGGSENINLELYNFTTQSGTFALNTIAYVGIGFGSGTQFNYGWIKLAVSADPQSITIYGWAYNDEVNQSITVGEIPGPGALGLLAIVGLQGRRRRA
ncbi:MAG: hypothetical protein NT059_09395 [Planctomycetota bacterium]|nr:hypothetical protein [Planctomycetota bacterium]